MTQDQKRDTITEIANTVTPQFGIQITNALPGT